ncbi:hypothetical protein JCM8547_004657 [Rhodosporidiobolus lusitaniae]
MAAVQSSSQPQQLQQPTFSFIHVLQLVQPVPADSPYRLPSLPAGPILPSRLAKTKAPFEVAPPTNLELLYQIAAKQKDPEELRRERNKKKKERKLKSKERKEAAAAAGETAEDGEKGEDEVAPAEPIYGLPADVPAEYWTTFEAHYHRLSAVAGQQREQAWKATQGDAPVTWGEIVLHDSISKRGKRDNGRGGFTVADDGSVAFHWVV